MVETNAVSAAKHTCDALYVPTDLIYAPFVNGQVNKETQGSVEFLIAIVTISKTL